MMRYWRHSMFVDNGKSGYVHERGRIKGHHFEHLLNKTGSCTATDSLPKNTSYAWRHRHHNVTYFHFHCPLLVCFYCVMK